MKIWALPFLIQACLIACHSGSDTVRIGTNTAANLTTLSPPTVITWDDLWDLYVGPVATATLNTTMAATPIPTAELIPPPHLNPAASSRGQQVPMATKNSSWSFPKGFWWGVASAAYQVEGAVKAEGRGPSIWDALLHRVTGYSVANETADIADNQYYMYKQDIARIAALGVNTYSFSISWSRVFPFGNGQVNQLALDHYDDVINTCIEYGVEPSVTLYHWDLPLYLQNSYGGWPSSQIVDDFVNYAKVIFSYYGNKVPRWYILNEPIAFCYDYPLPDNYFGANKEIPTWQQPYWCGRHALLAHSKAYHLAKSLGINGTISFKNNGGYKIPLTNSTEDAKAVERAWDFFEGWFANPVFINGNFPEALKSFFASFLPDFTDEEKQMINGTSDVFAHDAYTAEFYFAPKGGVDACVQNISNPYWPLCFGSTYNNPASAGGWVIGAVADPLSPWLHKTTEWVPAFLHFIADKWKPKGGIAITEFGFAEPFESVKTNKPDIVFDSIRSSYYKEYLEGILIAIDEGVNVVGCLAWSILDNLEWRAGYGSRFGIHFYLIK
ncbi:glycoside hydrolase family 1 protein [Hyaloscypha variabilis F]|uniref:Glycoside hydrolase family 1 protein n=1 Tax=Hyaloscypha variabilis (strain UAMH 11265 / GT02V1 / F) TaxID=1149755 RepID=A0A2J6RCY1_HYAVF|nr:glycoside hydrolase family 1 protein [Hyaloscypha variabilis F]